jgi:hypothetical protein
MGVDEDCNGDVNEDDAGVENLRTWYVDDDEDGFGTSKTVQACFEGPGLATVSTDCDDTDFDINPGTPEVCDALDKDEDCDGKDAKRWFKAWAEFDEKIGYKKIAKARRSSPGDAQDIAFLEARRRRAK